MGGEEVKQIVRASFRWDCPNPENGTCGLVLFFHALSFGDTLCGQNGGGSLDGRGAPRPMPGNDRRVVRREGGDVGIDAVPRAEGGPQLLGAGEGDLLWAGAEVSVARGLGQPM